MAVRQPHGGTAAYLNDIVTYCHDPRQDLGQLADPAAVVADATRLDEHEDACTRPAS